MLSNIREADVVAVLQGDAVSKMGAHNELMAKGENDTYDKLIHMQEQAQEAALVNAHRRSARPSSTRNSVARPS
jgi:ATP-binding cassette, subfamily B (MDR/TAP), member 1